MHVSFWPQFPSNCLFGWSLANIQPKLQQHMQSSHSSFALRRGLKATYWPLAFTKMQSLQLFVLSTLITNFAVLWMQLFLHSKSIIKANDWPSIIWGHDAIKFILRSRPCSCIIRRRVLDILVQVWKLVLDGSFLMRLAIILQYDDQSSLPTGVLPCRTLLDQEPVPHNGKWHAAKSLHLHSADEICPVAYIFPSGSKKVFLREIFDIPRSQFHFNSEKGDQTLQGKPWQDWSFKICRNWTEAPPWRDPILGHQTAWECSQ